MEYQTIYLEIQMAEINFVWLVCHVLDIDRRQRRVFALRYQQSTWQRRVFAVCQIYAHDKDIKRGRYADTIRWPYLFQIFAVCLSLGTWQSLTPLAGRLCESVCLALGTWQRHLLSYAWSLSCALVAAHDKKHVCCVPKIIIMYTIMFWVHDNWKDSDSESLDVDQTLK